MADMQTCRWISKQTEEKCIHTWSMASWRVVGFEPDSAEGVGGSRQGMGDSSLLSMSDRGLALRPPAPAPPGLYFEPAVADRGLLLAAPAAGAFRGRAEDEAGAGTPRAAAFAGGSFWAVDAAEDGDGFAGTLVAAEGRGGAEAGSGGRAEAGLPAATLSLPMSLDPRASWLPLPASPT